jgi:hypothetical protein
MGTNEDIFHEAVVYMQIICLGIPATAIYNFGAGIIRSVGDSRSPLYILATTGIINVLLNVVFVVLCDMTADGVAYATIISQYISAVAVVYILIRRKNEVYGLNGTVDARGRSRKDTTTGIVKRRKDTYITLFEELMEMEAQGLLTADLVRRFRRSLCEDEAWEPFVGVKLYVLDLFLETLGE